MLEEDLGRMERELCMLGGHRGWGSGQEQESWWARGPQVKTLRAASGQDRGLPRREPTGARRALTDRCFRKACT